MLIFVLLNQVQAQPKHSSEMDLLLQETQEEYLQSILPKLEHYCMDCHDPDEEDEALFLEQIHTKDILNHRHLWRSVAAQLRNRTMPPKKKKKQPTEQERMELSSWIDGFLNASAMQLPEYAGAVGYRRLNRNEYNNTIRDLFGKDFSFNKTFPVDSSGGEGFDNHAQTLYLPQMLMEKYLEAAREVLDEVIGTTEQKKWHDFEKMGKHFVEKKGGRTFQLWTSFKTFSREDVEISIHTEKPSPEEKLILKFDGILATKFSIHKGASKFTKTFTLERGIHTLSLEANHKKEFSIKGVKITIKPKPKSKTSPPLFFSSLIQSSSSESFSNEKARDVLNSFMEKAFRRPVRQDEVETYFSMYQRALRRGDPQEECLKLAFKAVMVSPHFIFMVPEPFEGEGLQALNSYELASRLSYFLWSSMPDQELFDLARSGELQKEHVLKQQIQRMLTHEKSLNFYENFTGQWLGTTEVGGAFAPNGNEAKAVKYRPELGVALREEPTYLMRYIFDENKSLLDLLDADYVVVNERIANHYQIPDIKGESYRMVQLKNSPRGGLLGLGGVHMATSLSYRTSPVKRGAWVIETLLGTPVPPPPDNVPLLDEKKVKKNKLSLREMYEEHRNNDSCSACHNLIDPIGLGLENFNFIGAWREKDKNVKIDASGVMPSGVHFKGPQDLKQILMKEKDVFVRHLTRKLLGYALGRKIVDHDAGTIERIVESLKQNNYSSLMLIEKVVLSTPFRYKQRKED